MRVDMYLNKSTWSDLWQQLLRLECMVSNDAVEGIFVLTVSSNHSRKDDLCVLSFAQPRS